MRRETGVHAMGGVAMVGPAKRGRQWRGLGRAEPRGYNPRHYISYVAVSGFYRQYTREGETKQAVRGDNGGSEGRAEPGAAGGAVQ